MGYIIDPYRFGVAGGTDPNFANVEALLHFNGADASTTFTDVTGRAWTANGNAQLDTAQQKFGTASMLCDGNGDFIQAASSADFNFGSSEDFTIEFWVRFNTVASRQIFVASNTSSIYYFDFRRSGTANMTFAFVASVMTGTTVMSTGNWYAIAVTRSGTSVRLFVDGTIEATATNGSATGTNGTFQIGCAPSIGGASLGLNGWLDEFRFTKGVARYTANYTPSATEFPDS